MPKPPSDWDEEHVLLLPLEDDRLERKGTRLLDIALPKVSEEKIRDELAKQLSAFANTGGGRIIYGLTDKGQVDLGGVSRIAKGNRSTKEWIEDLVPSLTDYEILGVNVYEITGKGSKAQIQSGKALYVVDIPDSERAPHQSRRDWRYYVRLGSKSQPAPHRLVEDIRNRARYPDVTVKLIEIQSVGIPTSLLPEVRGSLAIHMKMDLKNTGRIKANNTCVLIQPLHTGVSVTAFQGDEHISPRGGPKGNSAFLEIRHPIYPEMETPIRFRFNVSAELKSFLPGVDSTWFLSKTGNGIDDVAIEWTTYADSAPPKSGQVSFAELGFSKKAIESVQNHARWADICKHYGMDHFLK